MNFNFNQFLKSALVVVFIWLTIDTSAQSAYEGIRYQAILRDGSGSVISGQNVSLRMTIYQKGDLVNGYIETHETFTNIMGLINLTIGNGIPIQNTFSSINWGKSTSNPFFIKIEFSDNDGNTFLTFGESQLLSVPYAMYAKNVENVNDADANPLNEIQDLSLSGNILEISMNSASTLIDLSPYLDNTDAQVLSFGLDDTLHLTGGGKVYLGIYDIDNRFKAHIAQYTLDQSALALRLQNLSDSAATNYSTGISNSASIQNDSARLNQAKNDLKNTQDSVSVLYSAAFKDSSSTNEIQNILINVSNDSLLISDGQGIALNKLFEAASIAIDSLEDAYNDTNKNLFLGAKPNNLVKIGANSASNNVGVGTDALAANTSGSYNLGVGNGALYENTTGGYNIALGQEALSANKVGSNNTAIGRFALKQATVNGNTAIGLESSRSNTTGRSNTSVGMFSLRSNKTGTGNSALGEGADVADTNLSNATAIGAGAIVKASNTIQLGNGSIDSVVTSGKLKLGNVIYPNTDGTTGQVLATDGSGNLSFQTTNTSSLVPYLGATQAVNLGAFDLTVNSVKIGLGSGNVATNIALGNGALRSNTTGDKNTASGYGALYKNTTGNYNTASGFQALWANTTGSYNTALGMRALYSNTKGVSNTASGYIALASNTTGEGNTASGFQALEANTTGSNNTAIGFRAMELSTTSNNNVAFGNQALKNNRTGSGNTAIGSISDVADTNLSYATAIGFGAIVKASNTIQLGNGSVDSVVTSGKLKLGNVIYPNTDGTTGQVLATDGSGNLSFQTTNTSSLVPYLGATQAVNLGAFDLTVNSVKIGLGSGNVATNIALGNGALRSNTTGNNNTASGSYALEANTTGSYNTASGTNALNKNIIGRNNTAIGFNALLQNTTGSYNTASGAYALNANTTGSYNTASGHNALGRNTTGVGNTAIGLNALYQNTTGNNNTASGHYALFLNTTGSYNTASGNESLRQNTTGAGNTASGHESLRLNTTGSNNTASGLRALNANTTGSHNTASGHWALFSNTTGNNNTAIGFNALYQNTTGVGNTASGYYALASNTTGYLNAAIGLRAMQNTTTGNNNVAFGNKALQTNKTGSGNTAIGSIADVADTNLTYATAIGAGAIVKASNTIQLGNSSVDSVVTSGKLKLGNVIYPNTDGTNGQFLQTNGNGNLTWGAPMPNVIRSIVIAPGMFPTEAFSGSTTKKSIVGGSGLPVIEMGDNVSGQIAMSVPLPSDWVAGTAVKIKLLYSNVTNSGNISFRFGSAKLAENSTTITGISSSTVSLNVSSTAYGLKEYSHSISMNSTEKVLHFYLRRQGTNSADTNSGVMYIHGVNLEYTGK